MLCPKCNNSHNLDERISKILKEQIQMFVTVDSIKSYLFLGLVKRRYVGIFMNTQSI